MSIKLTNWEELPKKLKTEIIGKTVDFRTKDALWINKREETSEIPLKLTSVAGEAENAMYNAIFEAAGLKVDEYTKSHKAVKLAETIKGITSVISKDPSISLDMAFTEYEKQIHAEENNLNSFYDFGDVYSELSFFNKDELKSIIGEFTKDFISLAGSTIIDIEQKANKVIDERKLLKPDIINIETAIEAANITGEYNIHNQSSGKSNKK